MRKPAARSSGSSVPSGSLAECWKTRSFGTLAILGEGLFHRRDAAVLRPGVTCRAMNTLYFAPGACSFVPHVALELVKAATGEDFEPKMVKLHKGEQKSPEYLALNPNGQVPVLVVD